LLLTLRWHAAPQTSDRIFTVLHAELATTDLHE